MSKVNYLVKRLCKQKGVSELNIEDMLMEHLLDAFIGKEVQPSKIILTTNPKPKVKTLPTVYAIQLRAGKPVVIRDPEDNRIYYVKAFEDELVAVYHTLGPWTDIYSARSTNPALLAELGIVTNSFKDHRILDGIFQFPLEGPGVPVVLQPELMDVPPVEGQVWFAPVGRKRNQQQSQEMADEAQKDMTQAIDTLMSAASRIVESGVPMDVEEVLDTQMSKAFQKYKHLTAKDQAKPAESDTIIVAPTFGEVRRDRAPTA